MFEILKGIDIPKNAGWRPKTELQISLWKALDKMVAWDSIFILDTDVSFVNLRNWIYRFSKQTNTKFVTRRDKDKAWTYVFK